MMQSSVHDPHTTVSSKERNVGTKCIVCCLAWLNLQSHNSLLSVAKGLKCENTIMSLSSVQSVK